MVSDQESGNQGIDNQELGDQDAITEVVHEKAIKELTEHIKAVEKEIKRLIDDDSSS